MQIKKPFRYLLMTLLVLLILGIAGYRMYQASNRNSVPFQGINFVVSRTSILYDHILYVPYGVTVFGLASTNWQSNEASDIAQINSIRSFWHGNTVRLQIAPSILEANSGPYLEAVENEVSIARADELNVIISAQYERTTKIKGPDDTTVSFWKIIAPIYANDPYIWFDLFNEPAESTWNVWRNGGDGYVGMQTLVNNIRSVAPNNLIFAEGLNGARTLNGVTNYLIDGNNIVYSVHPYFNSSANVSSAGWDNNWGNLTNKIPIIVGEWGEFESSLKLCVPNAPSLVPAFLNYVKVHNIGLIAWSLEPGVMIRTNNLEDPTAFNPSIPFQCKNLDPERPNAQGAGEDIRALFISS